MLFRFLMLAILFALFAVLSNASSLILVFFILPFAVFSLAAAWFFFRSPALRSWTGSRRGRGAGR